MRMSLRTSPPSRDEDGENGVVCSSHPKYVSYRTLQVLNSSVRCENKFIIQMDFSRVKGLLYHLKESKSMSV